MMRISRCTYPDHDGLRGNGRGWCDLLQESFNMGAMLITRTSDPTQKLRNQILRLRFAFSNYAFFIVANGITFTSYSSALKDEWYLIASTDSRLLFVVLLCKLDHRKHYPTALDTSELTNSMIIRKLRRVLWSSTFSE
jgi:hypothetical protein